MKREPRRTRRPPQEAGTPTIRYHVPRHAWPTAWEVLWAARAVFVTGLAQPSLAPDVGASSPVEVFVGPRGAAIVERLGARLVGSGADPWRGHLREFEELLRADAEERARRDPAAQDALEEAFQREAARVRARRAKGNEA